MYRGLMWENMMEGEYWKDGRRCKNNIKTYSESG
jgi:hypothetical protein